ncbi:uncharacterized protein LOC119073979 [Bradysia coprophila]|uniref:uncharacterized protein LOC119073979 n=1 Tax=Bradysia coprophila TaxID=38358 RepID=UPI00187DD23F|nr:uncharacterized protein LOC119073979 [Bradysia coprophila]
MDLQLLSNNSNGGQPPSYNQVIEMNNFASVPLMEEAFSSSIFGASQSVLFEFNSSDVFGYSFFIRDSAGSLQAKGDVHDLDTSVQNINGMQMMKINKKESNELYGNISHKFDILHEGVVIGHVIVAEKSNVQECLRIINKSANSQIIVRSFKLGEFAIFRDSSSVTPLCNIQMSVGENDFTGKIIFHPETGITSYEQLLCTAAGIAFKVLVKQVSKREDGGWQGYVGGCLCVTVLIVIMIISWFGLEKWGCEHKKAQGYAGYRNRIC